MQECQPCPLASSSVICWRRRRRWRRGPMGLWRAELAGRHSHARAANGRPCVRPTPAAVCLRRLRTCVLSPCGGPAHARQCCRFGTCRIRRSATSAAAPLTPLTPAITAACARLHRSYAHKRRCSQRRRTRGAVSSPVPPRSAMHRHKCHVAAALHSHALPGLLQSSSHDAPAFAEAGSRPRRRPCVVRCCTAPPRSCVVDADVNSSSSSSSWCQWG